MRRCLGSIVGIAMAAACGCGAPPAATDSLGSGTTEPDIVTHADTAAPEPVDPSFRLVGTEPFWALHIETSGMRFTTPEDTAGLRFGAARAVSVGDSLRWNSVGDRGVIEAVITRTPCSDGMSDKTWPYRARVEIGKTTYEGCAEQR